MIFKKRNLELQYKENFDKIENEIYILMLYRTFPIKPFFSNFDNRAYRTSPQFN